MINNRQNGRRRGRGGGGGQGQGQRQGGGQGRPDNGNRIDNRARGNANQLYEKYKNLARDAQMSGDRVNTEYYLQFADHYFRVLSDSRARFEEQNPNAQQRRIQPVDIFDDFDGDDEYGDEGEPIRAGEQGSGQNGYANDRGGNGNGADRGGYAGGGNGQYGRGGSDRSEGQNGGSYGNRAQNDSGRRDEPRRYEPRVEERRPEPQADAEPRAAAQPRRDRVRDERPVSAPAARNGDAEEAALALTGSPVANDLGEDSPDGAEPAPVGARRRGRPRRPREGAEVPQAAIEADRLPPSLSIAAAPVEETAPAPAPRRRRARAAAPDTSEAPAG